MVVIQGGRPRLAVGHRPQLGILINFQIIVMFSFIQLPFQLPTFSLPSISVPASIQRRFIAFVLQKSLGHLVKPGQLDGNKINAQLGSGYVEVNDVQLDEHAINQSLGGLPVRLQEGSLGSVAVNLPFQNILTAPLSMTVDRLELSLVLQRPRNSQRHTPTTTDELFGDPLTQSMASVAQEFIHEELETSSLRESLTLERNDEGPGYTGLDDDMSTHVPGSLDPFVEDALPNRVVNATGRDAEIIDDVEGVSVLAQVVERLLARLSFKATNITIRITHEYHSEITLCLEGISYTTEERQESTPGPGTLEIPVGEKRTVRIDGIDILMRDLIHKEEGLLKRSQETVIASSGSDTGHEPLSTPPQYPPYEDTVDEDEEMDASMTESMISLPPPVSLSRSESDSPTSTVYLSTTSIRAHTPPPHSPDTQAFPPSTLSPIGPLPSSASSSPTNAPTVHLPDETLPNHGPEAQEDRNGGSSTTRIESKSTRILSFGKEPILITLATPPPTVPLSNPAPNLARFMDSQALRLSVTVGLVTIALQTTHVNAILSMVAFVQPTNPQSSAQKIVNRSKPNTYPIPLLASLHATGTIRGVQTFVFRTNPLHSSSQITMQELFDHPTSSVVRAPHVHLHLEGIEGSYSPTADGPKAVGGIRGGIKDLSAFHISSGAQPDSWITSPLLIIDHQLPSQYDPSTSFATAHYTIPVVNWTDHSSQPTLSGRPKRSLWRTKIPPQSAQKGAPTRMSNVHEEATLEAVSLRLDTSSGGIHVDIAPLHVFADTAMIGWLLGFIEEISPVSMAEGDVYDGDWDEEVQDQAYAGTRAKPSYAVNRQRSPTRTPRAQTGGLPGLDDFDGNEKKRLTDMMLADMESEKPSLHEAPGTHVRFVMIRGELRHNSSESKEKPRSGVFVMDLHEPHLLLCEPRMDVPLSRGAKARFAPEMDREERSEDLPLRLVFEWKHALAFYAAPVDSKVAPFLHIGATPAAPQSDITTAAPTEPCRPKLLMRYGEISNETGQRGSRTTRPQAPFIEPPSSTTSVEIAIPSISMRVGKSTLDGLQFWADDLARWAARALNGKSTPSDSTNSSRTTTRAPSLLIGSRYFAGRTASSVGDDETTKSAFEIKLNVDDASIQLQVSRNDGIVRPFDLLATDLEAVVRIKPEGRDETVIIATVLDLLIQDTTSEAVLTLLCLTSPRRLLAPAVPVIAFRLDSISLPDAKAKQSKVQLTISKFTYTVHPEFSWIMDLANFAKAPPGVFEEVIPSERAILSLNVRDGSICILPPNHPGALVVNMEDIALDTELVSGSPDAFVLLAARSTMVLLLDDRKAPPPEALQHKEVTRGMEHWMKSGYAPILHLVGVQLQVRRMGGLAPPRLMIDVSDAIVAIHFCADTIPSLASLAGDLATMAPAPDVPAQKPSVNTIHVEGKKARRDMSMSLEENAFRRPPALGPEPDMIDDDLPKNADFIDASYGPAAGARPMTEEDLEDFEEDNYDGRRTPTQRGSDAAGILSSFGGETIRLMTSEGIRIIEGYYDNIPRETSTSSEHGDAEISLRMKRSKLNLHLHSGYDWVRTRKTIEVEVKAIRRRLEKIKQLLAQGQTPDDSIEKTNALLFNSVYLGLDADDLDEQDLLEAIDANLAEEFETASQESWQSLPIQPTGQRGETKRRRQKTRTRSKRAEVEIEVQGLNLEFDKYPDREPLSSRILATVEELKILDHMKTSTWDNFLTSMRTDSRGNRRETESDMVRVELKMVRPVATLLQEEARLRAKILPIRLHVDQDALDFLKRFFSFQDTNGYKPPVPPTPSPETFFQHVEIFPVELKLDYKPKRVDYKALKEGKTIELMNFFHFEDAAMTLRRITLTGLTGWARLGDTLNDLWTPDVKANQLADVISGVAPIRSLVNVGTGMADLVLLPIAQYKKDKRVVRGVQKGMAAFMETTAIETIKLGARLATGTQVILEHAEHVLGAGVLQDGLGQFGKTITTEAMPSPTMKAMSAFGSEHEGVGLGLSEPMDDFEDTNAAISRYAAQPEDVREGIQTAYRSMAKNLNAAAQTILAVPMEVYEQSGSGGPVRAVVRAVPIAVIRPMIGASEAIRETLLGLRNTIDPGAIQENEDKYKGHA